MDLSAVRRFFQGELSLLADAPDGDRKSLAQSLLGCNPVGHRATLEGALIDHHATYGVDID